MSGRGEGDVVLVGAGPGTAEEVFGIQNAPIRELVMGIIDRFDVSADVEVNAGDTIEHRPMSS